MEDGRQKTAHAIQAEAEEIITPRVNERKKAIEFFDSLFVLFSL
jgi:hypothetical protein